MNKIYVGIIIVLVAIILFMRMCGGSRCPEVTTVKIDTEYIHIRDTITVEKPVPITKIIEHKPVSITVTDTIFLNVFQPVDTAAILKDYFATRYYSDTANYSGDTSKIKGYVLIQDSVTQNKIKHRRIIYDFNIATVTRTNFINPKNQIYLGLDIGGTTEWIDGGLQFTLKTKTDKMYHAGVAYTTKNLFYFHIGTDWKIHF